MQLNGWNYIPRGYGLSWDMDAAPLWLRCLRATPFLDRMAYPVMVRRQIAYLVPHDDQRDDQRHEAPPGWLVRDVQPSQQLLATFPQETPPNVPWRLRWRMRRARRREQYRGRPRR